MFRGAVPSGLGFKVQGLGLDGGNPAAPNIPHTPITAVFRGSKVMQDFLHPP